MRCRTSFMNAIPFPLLFAASVTRSEKKAMSTPLTPFQGAQLRTAAIFNGLANASDSSHISSPLDNSSLSSRSFGSAPTTPFSGSLLSAPNISSPIHDIAPSSAPEVASSYATTWVRVGVNRAQVLYDTVASSVFHTFPFRSIEFWTMYSVSFS